MMRRVVALVQGSHWLGARGRRILHTGAWSMIAKLTAAANLFVTVPFVLKALGPTEFGVWATLASLVTFAGFLDFGLGNGTMNLVASAHGRGESARIATIVHEGRRALLLIALLLAGMAALALPTVPWHRLLGVSDALSVSTRVSVGIVLATILLSIPLNLATRVQLGLGQGNHAFRWQAVGQALTLCLVILLAKGGAALEWLVAATVATPLVTSVANNLQLNSAVPRQRSHTTPRDPAIAAAIRNEGLLFFVLQLAAALAYSADLPLISAMRGPEEAGQYAIVQRLFSVIPMVLGLVWIPLWPLYRQALSTGDHAWVQRTLRYSLRAALAVAAAGAVILGIGFDWIARAWLHAPLHVSNALILGFAVWCIIDAAGTALATFLNAASIVHYQVVVSTTFALVCIAIKVAAIDQFGIVAVPWVTVTTYCLLSLVPTIMLLPRLLAQATSRQY